VFGSLAGSVEYGTDTDGSESYFMAVRVGANPADVDVQGQLAALLERAEIVLNMDPVDTDILARFVLDMLQFESLLASLESCDPGSELDMGPAWAMLRSVMLNTVRTFLDAAQNEAYTSREIVRTLGLWLQGGSRQVEWKRPFRIDVESGHCHLLSRDVGVLDIGRGVDAIDEASAAQQKGHEPEAPAYSEDLILVRSAFWIAIIGLGHQR